ncbi:MAG TPA: hypothetical protein VFH61_18100, partial [Thermoleophilia bacterium]|nr:hypothetical protein [Thermoleophilia bacterium]
EMLGLTADDLDGGTLDAQGACQELEQGGVGLAGLWWCGDGEAQGVAPLSDNPEPEVATTSLALRRQVFCSSRLTAGSHCDIMLS